MSEEVMIFKAGNEFNIDVSNKPKRIGYRGFLSFVLLFARLNWLARKRLWADRMQFTVSVPMRWLA